MRLISCISFDSYIKPQLHGSLVPLFGVVYLLIPTSNHNYGQRLKIARQVVYLLIPTSNHNSREVGDSPLKLYIF